MSKQESPVKSVTHFDAVCKWDYGELVDLFATSVPKVIFRDDTIVIDWAPVDGALTHTVLTRSADGKYTGQSVWAARTPREQTATVEAVLYSSEQGHMLVGEEKWSSGDEDWFVIQLRNGRAM